MLNSNKLNTLNQYPTVAEEKPANEKPAEEKPANEKPAEEKPAATNPAAAALQANSVAVAGVKTNPLQQTIAQPAQFQKVIQQPQAFNPAFVVNGQDWKTKNKLKLDEQRKLFIQHHYYLYYKVKILYVFL